MNKLFKFFSVLGVIVVLGSVQRVRATQAATPVEYRIILQRSLDDPSVEGFVVDHNCQLVDDFQICPAAGVALHLIQPGAVDQVYLYLNPDKLFERFTGQLPYELAPNDTMADVQRKLGHPKIPTIPLMGWEPGLPDEGATPDHVHYWAIYKAYHLTVVFNTPTPDDPNASIQMIVIDVNPTIPSWGKVYSL